MNAPATPAVGAGATITERLVTALSATWRVIQERHPDVPDVVLTLGSGTIGARRGEVNFGHFAASRWYIATPDTDEAVQGGRGPAGEGGVNVGEEQRPGLAELFVGGEGLRRGARAVLATLLHEAAHGVALVRGIKDTSRQGRYHNKKFRELGEELGLAIETDGHRGWSGTRLSDQTADQYTGEIAQLAEAITAYRCAESGPGEKGPSRNNLPATCGCEPARRIRVARSVLELGPISCGVCGEEFTVDEPDEPDEPDGRVGR